MWKYSLVLIFLVCSCDRIPKEKLERDSQQIEDLRQKIVAMQAQIDDLRSANGKFQIFNLSQGFPPMLLNTVTGEVGYLKVVDNQWLGETWQWSKAYNFLLVEDIRAFSDVVKNVREYKEGKASK